jgi:hypothetical protein
MPAAILEQPITETEKSPMARYRDIVLAQATSGKLFDLTPELLKASAEQGVGAELVVRDFEVAKSVLSAQVGLPSDEEIEAAEKNIESSKKKYDAEFKRLILDFAKVVANRGGYWRPQFLRQFMEIAAQPNGVLSGEVITKLREESAAAEFEETAAHSALSRLVERRNKAQGRLSALRATAPRLFAD